VTSRTRRLINRPDALVEEMLEGYTLANADVVALSDGLVVRARPKAQGRVGLVVANGSGHEPAMIGWVGGGLLDVNVPGPVFSSPGPTRIVAGIREADRGAGVLLLVSSHAGDIMNATAAIAEAEASGLNVEMVVLYDDVASAPKDRAEGRRGGAGLFFVWKLVGAMAETDRSLEDCAALARRVRDRTRSIAAAIGTVSHPVSGQAIGPTGERELAVGMGVHGESGTLIGEDVSADQLTETLVGTLTGDAEVKPGSQVGLLVNNSGSLTLMELSILYRGARKALERREIEVVRSWIGSYATTLDQAGFSIAISVLDRELEELYDAPANGAGFIRMGASHE
jgi:phosphoenolpyruvate---glycerone phosphotransferase subunit DhaK